MGVLADMLRVMGMVLRSRLDGSSKRNPFFVSATGAPIVTPKVLNAQELQDVMFPSPQVEPQSP